MADWRLARSLEQLRREVYERWPGTTVGAIGDTRHCPGTSDHCPNAAGVVRAIDVMNPAAADAMWDELLELRDPRDKYNIHDGQIVNSRVSPWVVRRYTGPNPHTGHIHVSVSNRASLYDDPSPWGIATQPPPDRPADPWETLMAELTDDERQRLKELAVYLAGPDGTKGDSFARQTLKFLRNDSGKLRQLLAELDAMGSSVRGLARYGIAAVRLLRDDGRGDDLDRIVDDAVG